MIEFPNKKYDVVYADPPWDMVAREFTSNKKLEEFYDTMTLEDIQNLDIESISKENSWLYLWVTDNLIKEGIEICNLWGFEYKRSFIWDKGSIGMGLYNRAQHEQLLLAKKGKPKMPEIRNLHGSVIYCKRGKHSVKPIIFRDIINKAHPKLSKIELFARPSSLDYINGWDYWGHGVKNGSYIHGEDDQGITIQDNGQMELF